MQVHGNVIMRRIRDKILRDSLLYMALVSVLAVAGYILGHTVVWHGTEAWYPLLHWMSDNPVFSVLFLFAVGEIVILVFYMYRMGNWMQNITDAAGHVLKEDQTDIQLPEELSEVEKQLKDVKEQLRRNQQLAKEAEQRKNDLVVYLAHDLKTPLTSVIGYLTLLKEEADISAPMRQKYLDIVENKALRLEELINEFFEITRFNLTNMELEKKRVNFSRMLEQTVYEFGPMLKQKNQTLRLDAEEDIMLLCDGDKMQRVVDNLLKNSTMYGYECTEIKLALREEKGKLVLTCSNHGPTIPEEKLNRIFEQFYRLDSSRTTSTGGSGLGLAIAKEIVRLHGGMIWAESVSEMTTFTVELPKLIIS